MRIGIISDIHSNLPALENVLSRLNDLGAERVYCLGDIVGYGPYPNECIELVRQHCSIVLRGNHDSGVAGTTRIEDFNKYGQAAIRWTAKVIAPEHLEYLRRLPLTSVQDDITLVHSSPMDPEQWIYVVTMQQAVACFSAFRTSVCFLGHTHLPMMVAEDMTVNSYRKGKRHLINVGSVGQPRDGNPFSACGFFETTSMEYSLERVPYDVGKTVTAIKAAGLPSFLGKRLLRGI